MLVLVALIWGTAFVFQAMGGDSMSAYAFNALRSLAAGIALLPVIAISAAKRGTGSEERPKTDAKSRRTLIIGGVIVGTVLAVASALQQLGINDTTVGKAGFITTLYIIMVPLLGLLFGKIAKKALRSSPKLKKKECVGCGLCANVCPAKAITIQEKKAQVDYKACIRCFCCQEFCPKGAMKVHRPWPARVLHR